MPQVADLLSHAVAFGFASLGAFAAVAWLRHRGRGTGWLALALVLLGLLAFVTQLSPAAYMMPVAVSVVSLFAFLGSAYALVQLRHSIARYPVRTHRLIQAAIGLAACVSLFEIFLPRPSHNDVIHLIAAMVVIGVWIGSVVEPGIHFWRAARDRPRVQRGRLRALSAGYAGIVVLLLLSVGFGFSDTILAHTPGRPVAVLGEVVALAVIPLLYSSFAPPGWLRRAWRAAEEGAFREAMDELLMFSAGEQVLAERAIDWAIRLVGADAGLVVNADRAVMASQGIAAPDAARLAATVDLGSGGAAGSASELVVPLRTATGNGALVLVAGPFTPVFGPDEVRRLRDYSASLSIALDRVRVIGELHSQTDRMESLLEAVSELGEGLLITEMGRLVYANTAYLELTGYSLDELVNRNLIELAPASLRQDLTERLASRLSGSQEPIYYESQLERKDGRVVDIDTVIHRLPNEGVSRLIAIVRDITTRKMAEAQLETAARVDALTNVANRRAWDDELPLALNRSRRDQAPVCVAIIDLDAFKEFNDDWGHQRGDRLLVDVATAWRGALRDVDFLARYGGDEFAVVMPGCTAPQAEGVLQRLIAVTPERQRASIGLAQWNGEEPAEELVARADAALFHSKRYTRGDLTLASAQPPDDRFTGWGQRIGELIAKRSLVAAYQPIVDLVNGTLFGYEALARPVGSAPDASVDELFKAAHRLGYTRDLDWLARRAALEGSDAVPEGALLFINVSASALLDPVHDVDQMILVLRTCRLSPRDVVLEISERDIISDLERLRVVLADYRAEGFRFALDDVGEGHSTLEVLAAAGAEYIKVARSLTERLDAPGPGSAVRAIVTFAASTGAEVIAEGISDDATSRSVAGLGIRLGQGFALGRPVYLGDAPAPLRLAV